MSKFFDSLDRDVCITALQGLHTFGPTGPADRQKWLKSAVWWLRRMGELQDLTHPSAMFQHHTKLAETLAHYDRVPVPAAFKTINECITLQSWWEAPAKKEPKRAVA